MPRPVDKDRKHDVSHEDHREPGQRQCLEMFQRRRQIDPDEDGEKRVGNVPGKKIAGKTEEPFHQRFRLWWPGKGRAIADRPVRHPVAARVFTSELRFTHAILPRRGRHAILNPAVLNSMRLPTITRKDTRTAREFKSAARRVRYQAGRPEQA